jgi:tetratricopeptide (TPR) repeat protein
MTSVAVSPDGRWLAVGGWKENYVRVWDLQRSPVETSLSLRPKVLVVNLTFYVRFSPDGRMLVSCTGTDAGRIHYDFWRVGTWETCLRIDSERNGSASCPPVFTGDGRLMALGIAPDQVLLADPGTGRELARLTTLQPVAPTPLVFSPDGTKLIARTNEKTVLVWDLWQIRDQLAARGLDWGAPPYPDRPASRAALGPTASPRAVRVIGEVVEPGARRAREMVEMNRRIAAQSDDSEALAHRGWLFSQKKKWPEAIADLEHFLRLRPGDSDACWHLGEAYEEAGKLAGAMVAYGRLLERDPENHEARFQRGRVALASAQPGAAADDFSRILAVLPDLNRARYRRAQAMIRLGRHREALADLDVLIGEDPNDFALYELRGVIHEASGDHEQARAAREKAISLMLVDPLALNDTAWNHAAGPITQRDPERAVALARRALALAPNAWFLLNTLGVAPYRAGDYAAAIPVLERSCSKSRGVPAAIDLFFLAMSHQKLGRASQAQACFDRGLQQWGEQKSAPSQWSSEAVLFRAEAEAVLAGPAADLPADVFAKPR